MSKKNNTVEESGVINQPLNNAELGSDNANLPATQPKKGKVGKKGGENKVGFGTRVKNFFKGIVSELKKVTWPTAGKVFAQFGTVCFVVLIFVLIIMGFDSLCSWLLKLLVGGGVA